MSATVQPTTLAPRLRGLLRGLRWRIRAYTLLQGLCLVVCWLVGMFWLALLLDYGPVWMGASEMPLAARAVLLVIAGAGAAVIIYRWIVRRTFASLADHSMAVLLERQNKEFHDSLLTSVEMHERPDHAVDFNREMLEHAGEQAMAKAGSVNFAPVFRWRPLWLSVSAAVLCSASVVLFAAAPQTTSTFQTAAKRILLLDDQPWKRMALLKVDSVTRYTYDYTPPSEDAEEHAGPGLKSNRPRLLTVEVPFDESRTARVPLGSSPTLTIHADITGHTRPGEVTLFWESARATDRDSMIEGDARDGWLAFQFAESPLKGIKDRVTFSALGYDFRTQQYTIEALPEPAVLDVQLIHLRPDYLVDESRSAFKRVEEPLTAGAVVPRGSKVIFRASTNNPLKNLYVYNVQAKSTEAIALQGNENARKRIEYTIESLDSPVALQWMLVDQHDLVNEAPHTVGVGVKEDEAPTVRVAVRGIGTAITPDATFAWAGHIADDYWLDRAWVELEKGERRRQLPLPFQPGGFSEEETAQWNIDEDFNVYHRIDLREERNREDDPLVLQPGDRITISAQAADLYDLDGFDPKSNPHVGVGDRYQLEIVTPDQLLSLLERRELELRRRLEQIVEELTQTRDSLVRVQNELAAPDGEAVENGQAAGDQEGTGGNIASEPGDQPLTDEEKQKRTEALRRLRVQRAVNQSEKSRGETEGVGRAMLDIVAQLENNRVDTEDRKDRLRDQVSAPLLALAAEDFVELDNRLAGLNTKVNLPEGIDRETSALACEHAVAQTDDVLLKLDGVLQKMVDMETFNELVDLIRDIIEEQDEVTEETKTVRKKQLFGLE